ncbi:MAG TPA: ribonuclease P protein component [Gammaproteobacteria bacterium]|nr:ribonuclease P protein component [Gammaproteobacteria bacterium]
MHTPAEFRRSFRQGRRHSDAYFTVYAVATGAPARLGMAVAKKAVPAAANRNRIKRVIRESFRLTRSGLPPLDLVVQAKPAAGLADNPALRQSLARHWQEWIEPCAAS